MPLSSRKSNVHWLLALTVKHGVHCRFMGGYIGTLLLMLKRDIPRIIGVFLVINFSFGGGLYFALVGHYNDSNVDTVNDNSTRYKLCSKECVL